MRSAVITERANERVADHAKGAQTMQDGPGKAGLGGDFGISVQRIVVAVESVIERLLGAGRQINDIVGLTFGHRQACLGLRTGSAKTTTAANERSVEGRGDQ